MARILDGKAMASDIKEEVRANIMRLKERGIEPSLRLVVVGSDQSSRRYVELKARQARDLGALAEIHHLEDAVKDTEVMRLIDLLNGDAGVHAILIQLPLPSHLKESSIVSSISPEKDVDGLTPTNLGRIMMGEDAIPPAGAAAAMEILKRSGTPIRGRSILIGGASNILGRPLASMLINEGGIVTVAPQPDDSFLIRAKDADILVVDFGRAGWVRGEMIMRGSTVIDAGSNYVNGKVLGDVDFDSVKEVAGAITPVPGGLGPMLVAVLMKNLTRVAEGSVVQRP